LETTFDGSHGPGNFARQEGFAAARTLVVEENAIAGMDIITSAIVDRGPIGKHFGRTVGAARSERRCLALRNRLDFAKHLTARRLIEPRFHASLAHRLENPDRADSGNIRRILRNIKAYADIALRPQMIDLIWLDLIDQFHQMHRIGEISVVKEEFHPVNVRILVEMVDAVRVKGARAPNNPVDLVPPSSAASRPDKIRPGRLCR
jgi:hypothetical protein